MFGPDGDFPSGPWCECQVERREVNDVEWMDEAACRESGVDPEVFFPVSAPGTADYDRDVREARRVCARCPVTEACLAFAIDRRMTAGVFAGIDVAVDRAAYGRARAALAQRRAG